MAAKIAPVLFSIFLLLNVVIQPCQAGEFDGLQNTLDNTIISPPFDIVNSQGTGDEEKRFRHLQASSTAPAIAVKETKSHKNPEKPFFHVLLATLSINVISMVALLSLIPVLLGIRWNFFKSVFWLATSYVQLHPEIASQFESLGISKSDTKHEFNKSTEEKVSAKQLVDLFVPSFTCGIILSTALFLVMPEAIVFIQRGTSSEEGEIEILPETMAGFGVMVMAGFMLPLVLGALFPGSSEYIRDQSIFSSGSLTDRKSANKKVLIGDKIEEDEEEKTSEDAEDSLPSTKKSFESISEYNAGESGDKAGNDTSYHVNPRRVMTQEEVNFRMAGQMCIGNSIHYLIDGFCVGVAFMTCSYATAVCVTIITAYIKVTQEVADYFLLTQSFGITIPRALLLIFASGVPVVVGSLFVISFNLDELTIGIFLALTAGIYLQKSASECLPRVYSVVTVSRDRFFSLLFFILGAIPIGVSLIESKHCN